MPRANGIMTSKFLCIPKNTHPHTHTHTHTRTRTNSKMCKSTGAMQADKACCTCPQHTAIWANQSRPKQCKAMLMCNNGWAVHAANHHQAQQKSECAQTNKSKTRSINSTCHAMPCMMICSAAPVPVRVGGTNAIVLRGRQVKSTNIF